MAVKRSEELNLGIDVEIRAVRDRHCRNDRDLMLGIAKVIWDPRDAPFL